MYPEGRYDVAGFLVGIVERDRVLDGSSVRAGDAILGFPSNGLHTNGYSLARKVLLGPGRRGLEDHVPDLGATLADALLRPHLCYLEPIRTLHDARLASAFAHITGGGLVENVPRVLPPACDALIRKGAWEVPGIFGLIQTEGGVREEEMYRVFNMGVGLAAMVPGASADEALSLLQGRAKVIGEIVPGTGTVRFG
jgi:phosphoribosylformylglycinamidine cyclo-ligase